MNQDYYNPIWAEHRAQFAADIGEMVRAMARSLDHAFGRLAALQFDAPWRRPRDPRFSSFR